MTASVSISIITIIIIIIKEIGAKTTSVYQSTIPTFPLLLFPLLFRLHSPTAAMYTYVLLLFAFSFSSLWQAGAEKFSAWRAVSKCAAHLWRPAFVRTNNQQQSLAPGWIQRHGIALGIWRCHAVPMSINKIISWPGVLLLATSVTLILAFSFTVQYVRFTFGTRSQYERRACLDFCDHYATLLFGDNRNIDNLLKSLWKDPQPLPPSSHLSALSTLPFHHFVVLFPWK